MRISDWSSDVCSSDLTEAGERLYPTLRDGFDMFERALADLVPAPRRAAVTLTAPILFTARRLLAARGACSERFHDFDLRSQSSNEPVALAAGLAIVRASRRERLGQSV